MGCARFERTLERVWPEWFSCPDLADHVRNCPECSTKVRIQARMANLLEGIGRQQTIKPELAIRIKQIGKSARRKSGHKASGWWMAVSLVLVALVAQWHTPVSMPRGFGEIPTQKRQAIRMVNARQVTEQGAMVLDKALAVMEPLALATTSTITRVLYEVTEPIFLINRS